jgi:ribonuclease HI
MVATVYTDASFLNEDGIGAYAYWMKTYTGSKQLARLCPAAVTDSGMAEVYAIYQAVGHACHYYPTLSHVNLFSDSLMAIKLLTQVTTNTQHKGLRRLHQVFRQLLHQKKIEVTIQYREGHGKETGNGGFAMKWCDNAARAVAMSELDQRHKRPRHRIKAADAVG